MHGRIALCNPSDAEELGRLYEVHCWSLAASRHRKTLQGVAADAVTELFRAAGRPNLLLDLTQSNGALGAEIAEQLIGHDRAPTFVGALAKEGSCACTQCLWLNVLASQGPRAGDWVELHWIDPQVGWSRALGAAAIQHHVGGVRNADVHPFRLQHGDNPAPVLCLPGAGASCAGLLELASSLGRHWNVFGVDPRGLDGLRAPHVSVEAAAAACLQAIARWDTEVPVHLIGHSHGGWLAFELGLRMCDRGCPPASLTLIDSRAPSEREVPDEVSQTTVIEQLLEVYSMAAGKRLPVTANALAGLDQASVLDRLHGALVSVGMLPARSSPQLLDGPIRAFGRCVRSSYIPRRSYPWPVGFVLLNERSNAQEQALAYIAQWRRYAPHGQFWRGDGDHMSVLRRPAVTTFAAWWNARANLAVER
ncbi:alpha/beta fold hydrolase [Xanthomonas oryzae]|nr:alpha/beta fold hydrolase [Xanthomonas oryzae]